MTEPVDFAVIATNNQQIDYDNGFADSADLDTIEPDSIYESQQIPELTFEERSRILEETVCRHPLNREALYKLLVYCQSNPTIPEIEEEVASYPEYDRCTLSPIEMTRVLERAFGLARTDLDANGEVVDEKRKAGLSEDELDDLIMSTRFSTTPEGIALVRRHDPAARIAELLEKHPDQADATLDLLSYINEEPRTYLQINQRFQGDKSLVCLSAGRQMTMQPSVLVDRLCRSGAITWKEGWYVTEAGKRFLINR